MQLLTFALLALAACSKSAPALVVKDLEPPSGNPSGGTVVQITGTDFDTHAKVEVTFGDRKARAIVVAKDRIQVESPAGKDGEEATVTVRFPDGRTATVSQKYRWHLEP